MRAVPAPAPRPVAHTPSPVSSEATTAREQALAGTFSPRPRPRSRASPPGCYAPTRPVAEGAVTDVAKRRRSSYSAKTVSLSESGCSLAQLPSVRGEEEAADDPQDGALARVVDAEREARALGLAAGERGERRERRRGGGDLVVQRRLGRRLGNGRPGRRRRERRRAGEEERARDGLHRRRFEPADEAGERSDSVSQACVSAWDLSLGSAWRSEHTARSSGFRDRRDHKQMAHDEHALGCPRSEQRSSTRARGRAQRARMRQAVWPGSASGRQRKLWLAIRSENRHSRDAPRLFEKPSRSDVSRETSTHCDAAETSK